MYTTMFRKWVYWFGLSCCLLVAVPQLTRAAPGDAETINVMAPLWIADWDTEGPQWDAFTGMLDTAASQGIDGVSVDVWWGEVQPDNSLNYNWAYYDKIFDAIVDRGLELVPIMSFHQCGGNVGDSCKPDPSNPANTLPIKVPDWAFTTKPYCVSGMCTTIHIATYVSEYGHVSKEAIAPWEAFYTYHHMENFMEAFEDRYSTSPRDYRIDTQEINISLGPAGELRYPSYNEHDQNAGREAAFYPNRGVLQSYHSEALWRFRDFVRQKYSYNIHAVRSAWDIPDLEWSNINPPTDHDGFFESGAYKDIQYGKDFTEWYNGVLVKHGREMLYRALKAFDDEFSHIPLGVKLPGVHWHVRFSSPTIRAAEVTAGVVPTNVDFHARSDGYGYRPVLDMLKDVEVNGHPGATVPSHEIVLHFTAAEKPDKYQEDLGPGRGCQVVHSAARTLSDWIAVAASDAGITVKAENALNGGLYQDGRWGDGWNGCDPTYGPQDGWDHIRHAFDQHPLERYYGLTLLRGSDVTSGGSAQGLFESFIINYQ